MKINKSKQRGAAAIEYAILAAAMSVIMFKFFGDEGGLSKAIDSAYEGVVSKLEQIQNDSK